jgi:hypothetical protein
VAYTTELLDVDGQSLRRPGAHRLEVKSANESMVVIEEGGYTGELRASNRGQTTLHFTLWTRYESCSSWGRDSNDFDVDLPVAVQ